MAKTESIYRYFCIIKKLRKTPSNFQEIIEYLKIEEEITGYNLTISKRTFQRDIKDIRSLFEINIEFNPNIQKYEIVEDEKMPNLKILETLEWLSLLKINKDINNFVAFENNKKTGTENIPILLETIKNRTQIEIKYLKSFDDETTRIVNPLGLKEFKARWYLVALDTSDNHIKTFGLDRIFFIEPKRHKFLQPSDFDLHKYFDNTFGIIRPQNQDIEEVILSFSPHQGKYLKSAPFHNSQEIIIDNNEELRIKLKIFITFDFVMELLSLGDSVTVIAPLHLRSEIVNILQLTLNKYKK